MKLHIKTLGAFDLKVEGESLLKQSSRSYRLYKLFQYFITFRNKKLLPETIIDNLWDDNESHDPKNMLRAQIFRLRQLIKKALPTEEEESGYLSINFNNGYYTLDIDENTIIDIDEFESLILKGDKLIENDIYGAIEAYKDALSIYKGTYLEENSYEVWLVPIRNYYSRLYLKTLFKLIETLKEIEEYEEILELCESAITIEPYEESIHIYLMEAMLKTGQIKNAMSHYEHISLILEKEMGTKTSVGMRDINRKIQNYFIDKSETDITNIKQKLDKGAMKETQLCDNDYFKFLFNIQKKRALRDQIPSFLGLIKLIDENDGQEYLKVWVKAMTRTLEETLRKGDAFSFWNDTQILLILNESKEEGLEAVEKRIRHNLKSKNQYFNINIKFLPITSESLLLQESPI